MNNVPQSCINCAFYLSLPAGSKPLCRLNPGSGIIVKPDDWCSFWKFTDHVSEV